MKKYNSIPNISKNPYFTSVLEYLTLVCSKQYCEKSGQRHQDYWDKKLKNDEQRTLATADAIDLHREIGILFDKDPFRNSMTDLFEHEVNKNTVKRKSKKLIAKRLEELRVNLCSKFYLSEKLEVMCDGLDMTLVSLREIQHYTKELEKVYKTINCVVRTKEEFLIACIHLSYLAFLTSVNCNVYLIKGKSNDLMSSQMCVTFGDSFHMLEIFSDKEKHQEEEKKRKWKFIPEKNSIKLNYSQGFYI